MNKVNTAKLRVGNVIVINGEPRIIVDKSKAFSAPEYFISFYQDDLRMTEVFHANKKWELFVNVGA